MNWKRLLLNLGAIAAGGFVTAVSGAGSNGPINGKVIGVTIGSAVLANLIGLFQPQPHRE